MRERCHQPLGAKDCSATADWFLNFLESIIGGHLLPSTRRGQSNLRPLGTDYKDWHLRQFEMCPAVCELRYVSNRISADSGPESKHAKGFKSIGFIQDTTKVAALDCIELRDSNSEKVHTWPFELSLPRRFCRPVAASHVGTVRADWDGTALS